MISNLFRTIENFRCHRLWKFTCLGYVLASGHPLLFLDLLLLLSLFLKFLLFLLCIGQLLGHQAFSFFFKLGLCLVARDLPFYTEEHGSKFCQPVRIDNSDAVHVFFCSHDKLMIHDVFWNVSQAKQGAAHMKLTRNTSSHINIVPNTFDFGGINEVTWTNCLTY